MNSYSRGVIERKLANSRGMTMPEGDKVGKGRSREKIKD